MGKVVYRLVDRPCIMRGHYEKMIKAAQKSGKAVFFSYKYMGSVSPVSFSSGLRMASRRMGIKKVCILRGKNGVTVHLGD